MLTRVAEGVFADQSGLLANNTVVVQGESGVLVVDPGQTDDEMRAIATGIRDLGLPVVAGFSTHPHWDHVLWHTELGTAPRYATAAAADEMAEFLADADWEAKAAAELPEELAGAVPLELFGRLTALPAPATTIALGSPTVRVLEHRAHSRGHAALFVEGSGVLIAGDMLSDLFPPMLDFGAERPIDDYLSGLELLESLVGETAHVIPGHGSIGGAGSLRARIDADRAYLAALRDGTEPDDARITAPRPGWEWVRDIHAGQREHFGGAAGR